jgi:uncharacterized protein DUF998
VKRFDTERAIAVQPTASHRTTSANPADHRALRLRNALAGLAAGPVLASAWVIQGLARDGYDFNRHPMSLLALGEYGWIQIANFVVTGVLMLLCAAGFRHSLTRGVGRTWVPRLVAAIGVGLITAGIFTADPGSGFPAGAPPGAPTISWHGALHGVGFVLVVGCWTAACLVLRRRFARSGQRGWAVASVALVVIALLIIGLPHTPSLPIRLVVASVLQLGFIGAVALHYHRS